MLVPFALCSTLNFFFCCFFVFFFVMFVSFFFFFFFFFQAEDGIRGRDVTGVQTCALPIYVRPDEGVAGSRPARCSPRRSRRPRRDPATPSSGRTSGCP